MSIRKIISIAGELGSGKSTVSKQLALLLGAKRYSTGDIQRQIAQSRGISTLELNLLAEQDSSIDREIDSFFSNIRDIEGDLVLDSRMAWHFVPESIKIRLIVSLEEAASRVHNDKDRISETLETIEEARSKLTARRESERKHFLENYNVDIEDLNNYDFVIDTTAADPQEVVKLIYYLAQEGKEKVNKKYWVSPYQYGSL